MKKISFLAVIMFMWLVSGAQQNHFIYLQTENKQAFYVKLDKKILSSSASGYLIIPKLLDGTQTLTLGFPKNEWPEQSVTCVIDKKDAGYILKNFGDKGWGLFSWQSLNVVMASIKKEEETPAVAAKKAEPEKIKEQPAVENIVQVIKEEPVTAPADKPAEQVIIEAKNAAPVKPASAIVKLFSNKTAGGIEMLFTDGASGNADTIGVFFSIAENENVQAANKTEVQKQSEIKEENIVVKVAETVRPKTQVKKELEINQADSNESIAVKENVPQQTAPLKKPVIQNSDCKAFATEDDFMKLRKKMAAEENDDDMVNAARKTFKTKCFTVEQIKNLSVLFLNDNGRYKFFDAAYPFISDTYNFHSLQKLLTDDYYINRFKAMLRQ